MLSVALLVCAHAAVSYADSGRSYHDNRTIRTSEKTESSGCYYEGTWYVTGTAVRTREACLACACAHGALSCRRRSCAPTPEPPPQCYVVHRRGECCPELHCPDRVTYLNHAAASSRTDDSHVDMPSSIGHACAEGGTIYAAGSAMTSSVACEQCFCLAGMRRCVRPRCLPPPAGCTARPASGACCPQRYYCVHAVAEPPDEDNSYDCVTPEGAWFREGSRVKESEDSDCIQCFCLHGSIRCQHLSCAPTLHGCKPLVQPGQCCAHQYACDHNKNGTKLQNFSQVRQNILLPLKEEIRSFHISKSTKRETTLKGSTSVSEKSTAAVTVTKEEPIKSTAKVKRKTEENQFTNAIAIDGVDTTRVMTTQTTLNNNDITSTVITESTTEMTLDPEESTTEQPEGVRIIINGTINCTAELSSTSLIFNVTDTNETIWIQNRVQPRIPLIDKIDNLDHTFSPNDIITEGYYSDNFDENETFDVNVTSSLQSNITLASPSTVSSTSLPETVLPGLVGALNDSKTKKEEYDYDYREPTLPPSLPNLKIIPFVAADAVLDDDMSSKEMPSYPSLTKEARFPVYYPTKESKETVFATRRDDVYNLTHFMFAEGKEEPRYPGSIHDEDPLKVAYPSIADDPRSRLDVHEYKVSASFGDPTEMSSDIKSERNPTSNFDLKIPDLNLFSPPVETEGGFVPRDPVLIDDYYSLYQKTSSGIIPPSYLTTSMPLNTKEECLSEDGRRVPDGESITFECSLCSCAWGELHCSPRPCHTPPGCIRQQHSKDGASLCCGELVCGQVETTTKLPTISTSSFHESLNETRATPMFEDKNDLNVTQNINGTFGDDESYNNKPSNNILIEHTSEDASFETPTALPITNGNTSNSPTTEKSNDPIVPSNHSVDYEEEDDDDEGFSLGSVLKLLLSETYDTTTSAPRREPITAIHPPKAVSAAAAPPTTKKQSNVPAFVPIKHHYPYIPPKHTLDRLNTVDRIDHLVLGEASAIRTTTARTPATFKPIAYTTTERTFPTRTTRRPVTAETVEVDSKEGFVSQSAQRRPTADLFSGSGFGLPKLAGCNIYGRMYRVGRIIAELSSPCRECQCTEVGVQCRSLAC